MRGGGPAGCRFGACRRLNKRLRFIRGLGCHDIVVSSNQFEENQDALHCSDGFNLCMSGNCVDDHLGRGVVIENTYGSVVSGNMIEECHEEAIVLDRDCYGITLSANVIAHNGGGIHLVDAHGCSVSASTFTLMKSHAIRIGPGSGRIAVGGNSFCNSYVGDGQVKRGTNDLAAAGIVLDGTSNIAISGNTFSGLTTKALVLTERPSTRILFEENLLTEVTSDHGNLPPLSSVHGFGPASASGRGGAGPPSPGLQLEMSAGGGDANAKALVVRRHGERLTDSAVLTIIEGKPGLKFDKGGIGPISPALALCALGVAFFAVITLLVLVAAILRIRYAMAIPLTGGMEASAAYPAISGAR